MHDGWRKHPLLSGEAGAFHGGAGAEIAGQPTDRCPLGNRQDPANGGKSAPAPGDFRCACGCDPDGFVYAAPGRGAAAGNPSVPLFPHGAEGGFPGAVMEAVLERHDYLCPADALPVCADGGSRRFRHTCLHCPRRVPARGDTAHQGVSEKPQGMGERRAQNAGLYLYL